MKSLPMLYPAWMLLLTLPTLLVLLPTLPSTQAQFRFPSLPSPPRLFFGGFRPLFSRGRRPQSSRRPFRLHGSSLGFIQQNLVTPPASFRSRRPNIRAVNFRTQQSHPNAITQSTSTTFKHQPPSLLQSPPQSQREPKQEQLTVEFNGFGAPKPHSIISSTSDEPERNQVSQRQHRVQPQSLRQQTSSSNPFLDDNRFNHRPINFIDENNIIGMIPPPPLSQVQQQQFGPQNRPVQRPISNQVPQQQQQFGPQNRPVQRPISNQVPQQQLQFGPQNRPVQRPISNQVPQQQQQQFGPQNRPVQIPISNQVQQHQRPLIQPNQQRPVVLNRPVPPPSRPAGTSSQIHHAKPIFEQIQSPHLSSIQEHFQFVPIQNIPRRPQEVSRPLQQVRPAQPPTQPVVTSPQQPANLPTDPSDLSINFLNSIDSNSIGELVVNKVPPVNAGVLPLAHEKPLRLELFPPFTTG